MERCPAISCLSIPTLVLILFAGCDPQVSPEREKEIVALFDDPKHIGDTGIGRDMNRPGRPIIRIGVHGRPVTDEMVAKLDGLTTLRSLDLGRTAVTDAGLVHVATLKNLEELCVCCTMKITDAGLVNLEKLTKLNSLDLGGLNISDRGLSHVRGLTELEYLSLYGTKVDDAGMVYISRLTKLRTLVLASTKITDAAIPHLAKLTNLRIVSLQDTKVSDTGIKRLTEALPHWGEEPKRRDGRTDLRARAAR
jgi:Leucine-rich repeat (LRR) protein